MEPEATGTEAVPAPCGVKQYATPPIHPKGGPVRLYAGACESRPIGGDFDAGFMDPPYNYGIDYGSGASADRVDPVVFRGRLECWLGLMYDSVRYGGSVWVLLPDEWVAEAAVFLKGRGGEMRNWIKWHETFGTQTKMKFARLSRHLLYFVKPGPKGKRKPFTFNADAVLVPSEREATYGDGRAAAGGKVMGDVWQVSRICGTFGERAEGFPTQVPEAMLERIVSATTNPGDRVLEFFAGSGSLARVCLREGRGYEGWEANASYARKANVRVQEVAAAGRKNNAARR